MRDPGIGLGSRVEGSGFRVYSNGLGNLHIKVYKRVLGLGYSVLVFSTDPQSRNVPKMSCMFKSDLAYLNILMVSPNQLPPILSPSPQ